jgi:hypothetical protein
MSNLPPGVTDADIDRHMTECDDFSDCCSAPMIGDEDPICSECKEHCEAAEHEEFDPSCDDGGFSQSD